MVEALAGYAPVGVGVWAAGAALFVAAAFGSTRDLVLSGLAAASGLVALYVGVRGEIEWTAMAVSWAAFSFTWTIGAIVRLYRAVAARAENRAELFAADREARAREAVANERARLARELHDSVGHALNVIVLHAGGAQRVLEKKPDVAREALDSIEARGTPGAGRHRAHARASCAAPRRGDELRRAAGLGQLDDARRAGARGGPAGRAARRGRRRDAAGEPRPLGLPDRPGGADQHAQARRQGAQRRDDDVGATTVLETRGRGRRPRGGRRAVAPAAAAAWSACASASCSSAASCWSGRGPRAASGCGRGCRMGRWRADVRRSAPAPHGTRPATTEGGSDMSIRILLVDDEQLVRSGLRLILEAEPDLEVVGEAGDGARAWSSTRRLDPDVVLMDIQMPGMNGLEATREIVALGRDDSSRVVILTTFDLDEYVYEALRAGASGFLLKRTPAAGPRRRHPRRGRRRRPARAVVTRRLIGEFARRPAAEREAPPALDDLTAREREVLGLVALGMSNAEIAAKLFLSEGTVKTHVKRIFYKMGLRDRTQAVILAYDVGLVEPKDH